VRTRIQSLFALIAFFSLAATSATIAHAQDVEPGHVALRPAEVDAVAKKRLPKVRSCYSAAVKRAPSTFGVVAVGMNVSPAGKVGDRWITISTAGDPELEKCILQAFEGLEFPAPGSNGAVVRYGMLLTTKDSPVEPAKVQQETFQRSLRDQS
jgi:hypothetical protein